MIFICSPRRCCLFSLESLREVLSKVLPTLFFFLRIFIYLFILYVERGESEGVKDCTAGGAEGVGQADSAMSAEPNARFSLTTMRS